MNIKTKVTITTLLSITIASCAFFDQNKKELIAVAKTGAIILQSDDIAKQLEIYIANDTIATDGLMQNGGPVEYALEMAAIFKGDLDVPILDMIEQYPEKLTEFKTQMLAGRDIVVDYSNRTGKPIPINLRYFWVNGEDAIQIFDLVLEQHDNSFVLREIYTIIKPYALLGLKLGIGL